METLSVLSGHHQRAVVCVSLSQEGSVLASVGGDDHHTLVLWNWRSGQKLASARSGHDVRHSYSIFHSALVYLSKPSVSEGDGNALTLIYRMP